MAWAQNDRSRAVSVRSVPIPALNHCRSVSMRLTRDIGAPQTVAASETMSSKSFSGAVSRTLSS